MNMLPQQYCLRWKHHHSNVQNMFSQLLEKERFCDVTLYCSLSFASQLEKGAAVEPESIKGVSLRAHRVVLASCSELLGSLLCAHEAGGEPVLVIDGAEPSHVRALLRYMYTGEMCVHRSQLQSLLKTAEELKIKGLTDIRWNNKDEPPDCQTDAVSATPARSDMKTYSRNSRYPDFQNDGDQRSDADKFSVNGGPPPLIKLPSKEKISNSPSIKREAGSDTEDQNANPKRRRTNTGNEHSDNEDNEQEWRHGNLDISAERVMHWGPPAGDGSLGSPESLKAEAEAEAEADSDSDEPWGDAPADIGSFLHTRLTVDGDNSGEESNEGAPPSTSSSTPSTVAIDLPTFKPELAMKSTTFKMNPGNTVLKPSYVPPVTSGPKSGPTDPRFTDVIKLNDYLRVGRRPQFWEEDFVKRVMEAIRLKELEMKQAAEILGVSYGTLYGRYRDAYGCINRPFRTAREVWSSKSATEVLERLKRGDIPMDVAAQALGCSARDLYVHYHDIQLPEKEFEPIPIEIDPSLRMKTAAFAGGAMTSQMTPQPMTSSPRAKSQVLSAVEKVVKRALEESGVKKMAAATAALPGGRWRLPSESSTPSAEPTSPTSPTLLMKSRPDLTIVAAKRPEPRAEPDPKAEQPEAETQAEDENVRPGLSGNKENFLSSFIEFLVE